jgi:hypothetical protein
MTEKHKLHYHGKSGQSSGVDEVFSALTSLTKWHRFPDTMWNDINLASHAQTFLLFDFLLPVCFVISKVKGREKDLAGTSLLYNIYKCWISRAKACIQQQMLDLGPLTELE